MTSDGDTDRQSNLHDVPLDLLMVQNEPGKVLERGRLLPPVAHSTTEALPTSPAEDGPSTTAAETQDSPSGTTEQPSDSA